MRLSQLARKLEISPSELILFFKENKIKQYNSHNNKVLEGDLMLALHHFLPHQMKSEAEELDTPSGSTKDGGKEIDSSNSANSGPNSVIPEKESSNSASAFNKEEEIELIRMPKIKLEGVKVVGKIDLPEPAKKVRDHNEPGSEDDGKPSDKITPERHRREIRIAKNNRSLIQKNKHSNPGRTLSYEERLKSKERKMILEQQKAKKQKKEQKKQHYIKNVQSNISPVRKKKKARKAELKVPEPVKIRPEYRNPVRKFWAWLNGEYDK